jgi:hypothetical protein
MRGMLRGHASCSDVDGARNFRPERWLLSRYRWQGDHAHVPTPRLRGAPRIEAHSGRSNLLGHVAKPSAR